MNLRYVILLFNRGENVSLRAHVCIPTRVLDSSDKRLLTVCSVRRICYLASADVAVLFHMVVKHRCKRGAVIVVYVPEAILGLSQLILNADCLGSVILGAGVACLCRCKRGKLCKLTVGNGEVGINSFGKAARGL